MAKLKDDLIIKLPSGRPTDYNSEYCKSVSEWLREGYSIVEIAYELNVHRDTIYQWMKVHSEFSDIIKKGKDHSEAWWTLQGKNNIHNKEFNSTLWYMNMKNRHGWKDKSETTHDVTVREEVKDIQEIRKLYKKDV